MFRSKLLAEVRSNCPPIAALECGVLSFESSGFKLGPYDLINMALVYRQAMANTGGRTAVVCPSDPVTRVLGVLGTVLALAELDSGDHATDLASALRTGDFVKLDGRRAMYVRYDPDLGFCLRFKASPNSGGSTLVYIKRQQAHRLIKYEGNAKTLNRYRAGGSKTDLAAELISQVTGAKLSDITGVLHKRRLLLVGNWQFAEFLRGLRVYGKPFGDVFPTAYFSSLRHWRNVGHRASQKNPNVCIVPNLSVGRKLALSGDYDPIHSLLVTDSAFLGGHAATLDQIGVQRVFTYKKASEWTECDDLDQLGFRVWLWSDADLERAATRDVIGATVSAEPDDGDGSEAVRLALTRHLKVVAGGAPDIDDVSVAMPDGWYMESDEVEQALRELVEVNKELRSSELRKFLAMGWAAFINVASFPYVPQPPSLKDQDDSDVVARLLGKLKSVAQRLPGRVLVGEASQLPACVVEGLEVLRRVIRQSNPRAARMVEWIRGRRDTPLVIVRHRSFVEPTRAYLLREVGTADWRVITPLDIKKENKADCVLYTAWSRREEIDQLYDSVPRSYTFLLAEHERSYFNNYMSWRQNFAHRYTDPGERACLLDVDEGVFERHTSRKVETITPEEDTPEDPDDILSEIVNSGTGASSGATSGPASDEQVEAYRVDFEEDAHGYFTKGFRARVMDRATGHLERKKVEELQVGDELIFAAGSNREIFDTLASEVEDSPEMREVVQLSEAWWRALRRYMHSTGQRFSDVMDELSAAGFDYQPGTISAWVQGERMRPGGYSMREVITAIAAITGDDTLTQKTDAVISACGKRQSVHVKLGKYLTQQITRAVADDDTEQIDDAFKPIADKLARSADVVTVCAVADTPSEVERSVTNRLIRDRHAMWVDLFEDIEDI